MKKLLTIAMVAMCCFFANSQTKKETLSVEKSIFGIQAGLFGANVYNESKLADKWSLRSEIGVLGGYSYSSYRTNKKSRFVLVPSLSVEPRYYYNFTRRQRLNKKIANNSGNYFGLKVEYQPNWFIISNHKHYINDNNFISLIPSWGLRRSFAKNFEYEFRVGYGYYKDLNSDTKSSGIDLGFKLGYRF